jgi:hypothetical protein
MIRLLLLYRLGLLFEPGWKIRYERVVKNARSTYHKPRNHPMEQAVVVFPCFREHKEVIACFWSLIKINHTFRRKIYAEHG